MILHKIAIPTVSPEGLRAPVENRFGRCGIFTIINQENGIIREVSVEQLDAFRSTDGPGSRIAKLIISREITDIILGRIGPNAYYTLAGVPNLKLYQIPWDRVYTVKNVLDLFNIGKLSQFNGSSFPPPRRRHRHGKRGGFS